MSLSRLTLVMTVTVAIAAYILLVQDVAPKSRAHGDRPAAAAAETMKIVPAEADRDRRDWHMPTGDGSAN